MQTYCFEPSQTKANLPSSIHLIREHGPSNCLLRPFLAGMDSYHSNMRQQRIDRFLLAANHSHSHSPSKPRPSLLDLPASLRKRIFCAVGPIPSQGEEWGRISMNQGSYIERGCLFQPDERDYYPPCEGRLQDDDDDDDNLTEHRDCPWFPVGLFSVC